MQVLNYTIKNEEEIGKYTYKIRVEFVGNNKIIHYNQ